MSARRVVFATLAATLVAAAPAPAAEKAIWGPLTMPNGSSALPVYERLGVDTLQLQLTWNRTAPARPADATDPSDPAYRWPADIAAALAAAPRHGLDVALLVTGAPGWSNRGRDAIWAPASAQDFDDFLTAAARRYPRVRRWMICASTCGCSARGAPFRRTSTRCGSTSRGCRGWTVGRTTRR